MSNPIAYIINENNNNFNKPEVVEQRGDYCVIKAILQDYGINRNKRLYKKSILEKALKEDARINELMRRKSWYGESGHPLEKDAQRQFTILDKNISHKILSLDFKPNCVEGTIMTTSHELGKVMRDEIRAGTEMAFSMRGMGPVLKKDGNCIEVGPGLKIFCYDKVLYPSHANAYQTSIIKENADLTLNESCLFRINDEDTMLLKEMFKRKDENYDLLTDEFSLERDDYNLHLFRDRKKVLIENDQRSLIVPLSEKMKVDNMYRNYIDYLERSDSCLNILKKK